MDPYFTTGLARHIQHLSHIGAQPKPFKQIRQEVELPMCLVCLNFHNESVVSIKIFRQPLNVTSKSLYVGFICPIHFCHYGDPVLNKCVHYHIEDSGEERIHLGHAVIALKRSPKVSTVPRNHGQVVPLPP